MITVFVTGHTGQVGSYLVDKIHANPKTHLFTSQKKITDPNLYDLIREMKPHVLINCAAVTNVDQCEEDPGLCFTVNAAAPIGLANVAAGIGAVFIDFSTDFVFDGTQRTPYREHHATNPVSIYGRAKSLMEETVTKVNPRAIILRTSWVFSGVRNNFLKTILNAAMSTPNPLRVVGDQFGTPTPAYALADGVMRILERANHSPLEKDWTGMPGIYHLTGAHAPAHPHAGTGVSWHHLACEIVDRAREKGLAVTTSGVESIRSDQYATRVTRPAYSVLDCARFDATFCHRRKPWQEGVTEAIDRLTSSLPGVAFYE